MKLFTLVADLTLSAAGFAADVATAKAEGKSLAQALGADSESIKQSFSDAFSFAAGDLLADAVREGLQAMGQFVGESIGVASDLEETNSKIDAIFGSMADNVHTWAKTTKDQFGIGEFAAKGYAGQLASLLSADSLALSTEQIYEMSTGLVELAGDLASFHNMSFDTVWTKLLSGMRGETEAIEDLGVDVRASAMAAYLGIGTDDWGKLDQQTRTLATYEYILENTTVAQGDFVRTQDQYANQMRIFNENITQLKASLGESLLPAITSLVTWFNSFFDSEEEAAQSTEDFASNLNASFYDVSLTTERAWALVTALEEMEGHTKDAAASDMWNEILAELNTVLPGIGTLIDTTTGQITGGTEALRAYVEQWETSAYELARTTAIKSYYDEYAQMQRNLYDLEIENAINQRMISGMTANVDLALESLMERAVIPYISADYRTEENLAYLRSTEGLQELYDALSMGDLDAIISGTGFSLSSMFDAAGAWDQVEQMQTLIGQYEAQLESLPTYEAEIALAREQISAYEQRLAVLEQIVANQEPPTVLVTVNNSANEDYIVSAVEHRITRNATNKSFTAATR